MTAGSLLRINYFNFFFSYIVFVPFETEDQEESGIVYVWIGSKSTAEESKLIQDIAEEMFNNPWVSLQVMWKNINNLFDIMGGGLGERRATQET